MPAPCLASLLQGLPGIPPAIKDQGLVSVVFVLVVFLSFGILLIKLLPGLISPLVAAVDRLTVAIGELRKDTEVLKGEILRELERLESDAKVAAEEGRGGRTHLHDRITPLIAGLTIAWLRRTGYEEQAKGIEKAHPDAVLPPDPR